MFDTSDDAKDAADGQTCDNAKRHLMTKLPMVPQEIRSTARPVMQTKMFLRLMVRFVVRKRMFLRLMVRLVMPEKLLSESLEIPKKMQFMKRHVSMPKKLLLALVMMPQIDDAKDTVEGRTCDDAKNASELQTCESSKGHAADSQTFDANEHVSAVGGHTCDLKKASAVDGQTCETNDNYSTVDRQACDAKWNAF